MVGNNISHYRIDEKLGEGGMGVVYKAMDLHLDRFVAIKVLSADKVSDPERRRRFVQEAKAASALNHPNIVHIYDIDEAGGVYFMAMEYVAGQTLEHLIGRKGLPLKAALDFGIQISGALSRAHSAGIVHRDLKPSNVMVDEHGAVKVLDFGLAKLTEAVTSSEEEATRTIRALTEEGTIVGTVAYMSPEQAEGKPVDTRSDIFSFGSLLYEMVTGQRAFQGDTKISALAAVINREPEPLSVVIPRDLEKVITRCLRKQPERRFQHMGDVRVSLEELNEESESGRLAAPAMPRPSRSRRWIFFTAALFLVLAAAAGAWWWLSRSQPPPVLALTRMTFDSGLTTDPALSPDGKLLAYASDRAGDGNLDIWVRQTAGGEPIRITRDPADDSEPAFSPDGSAIAFRSERAGGGIYIVPTLGGDARLLVRDGRTPRFSPDGSKIAYWTGNPRTGTPFAKKAAKVFVIPASGGTPRQLAAQLDVAFKPAWLAGGKYLVVGGVRDSAAVNDTFDFYVTPLDASRIVRAGVCEHLWNQSWLGNYPSVSPDENNRWILAVGMRSTVNLWQVQVSPGAWFVRGVAQRLTTGTGLEEAHSVAAGGLLAFASLAESSHIWRLPLHANEGKVAGEPQPLTQGPVQDVRPAASADGKRVVFISNRTGSDQVWGKDLETGKETALTATRKDLQLPVVSPDGARMAYLEIGRESATYVVPTTGAGVAEKLCEDCGQLAGWSPDGKKMLYGDNDSASVNILDLASGRKTRLLHDAKHSLFQARFSPDGRWICFLVQLAVDSHRIMAAPFRQAEIPPQEWIAISDDATTNDKPRWSPDGNLVYYSSERDGFRCIWAQRLDPATKQPRGAPWAVYHSHSPQRSLGILGLFNFEMSVTSDALIFNQGERTGNIWLARPVER